MSRMLLHRPPTLNSPLIPPHVLQSLGRLLHGLSNLMLQLPPHRRSILLRSGFRLLLCLTTLPLPRDLIVLLFRRLPLRWVWRRNRMRRPLLTLYLLGLLRLQSISLRPLYSQHRRSARQICRPRPRNMFLLLRRRRKSHLLLPLQRLRSPRTPRSSLRRQLRSARLKRRRRRRAKLSTQNASRWKRLCAMQNTSHTSRRRHGSVAQCWKAL